MVLWVVSSTHPLRHHGVQGWPAIPRARRYSHLNRDRQNIISRLPGVLVSSCPIKGQAQALQGGRRKGRENDLRLPSQRSTSQAIISILFFLSLRLGLAALSRKLVTPTQAPRCKEIQTSPPAGRRAFICLNQDKPPCVLLASPSRKGTHSTHSSV
jgi:hypothetical protein